MDGDGGFYLGGLAVEQVGVIVGGADGVESGILEHGWATEDAGAFDLAGAGDGGLHDDGAFGVGDAGDLRIDGADRGEEHACAEAGYTQWTRGVGAARAGDGWGGGCVAEGGEEVCGGATVRVAEGEGGSVDGGGVGAGGGAVEDCGLLRWG